MPAVLFNDTLYISNTGEILTGFNYEVQIPSYTESGDCKTVRSIVQSTSSHNCTSTTSMLALGIMYSIQLL